ncbi:MAG: Luciferase-like monooxygenase, partial [Chloroflexi bacterium]|nr:Luciferase-like monooxygenase [Chloroflexota bacterium]
QAEINRKVAERTKNKRSAAQLRDHGVIVGTGADIREQVAELAEAGVEQVMLQWLDLDDLAGIESLAEQTLM